MNSCFLWMTALLTVQSLSAYPKIQLGDSCALHWGCGYIKYAYCSGGKCLCLPGYIAESGARCKGDINATCDSNKNCYDARTYSGFEGLECILNTCQNYTVFFTQSSAEQKQLYRATNLGSHCETDDHCSNLHHAVCRSGKCTCGSRYWEDDRGICQVYLNATCSDRQPCVEPGTECFLHHCILPIDFFAKSNARMLSFYVAKKLGDRCSTDYQCRHIPDTHCKAGRCVCNPDFATVNDQCIYGLNTYCVEDKHCGISGVRCILDKCVYLTDFFTPSNSHNVYLYAAKSIHDYCETDHHCRNINNTHCVYHHCSCKDGYEQHSESSTCAKKILVRCSEDSDCSYRQHCFFNTCLYPYEFFTSSNSLNTSLYATKHIGGYCENDRHCRNLRYSKCTRYNSCRCINDINNEGDTCKAVHFRRLSCSNNSDCFIGWGKICFFNECYSTPINVDDRDPSQYVAKHIGDNCFAEDHCRNVNNSECVNYFCTCKPKYELISGECIKKKPTSCVPSSGCSEPNTHCFIDACLSREDFFVESNTQNISLYATYSIFGPCRSDHHCRNHNNSYCHANTCNCRPGYESVSGVCKQAINVTCSDDSDCLLPRSFCFLNTCLYPEDFLAPTNGYNTSLYVAKGINGFCLTDHHCREIKHSICLYRRCTCDYKYLRYTDECQSRETEHRYSDFYIRFFR